MIRPRRSFLFVPGSGLAMFPKALKSGADIVCVDLEDAIAPQHKAQARADTLAMFGAHEDDGAIELLVRVNSLRCPDGLADMAAILDSAKPPPGLMVPKVKSPDEVRLIDDLLTAVASPIRLQIIIETNEGLAACHEIAAASPRIDSLLFGAVDMAAELRVAPTWEALVYARSRLVHAAASAGIDMIDVPWLDLQDQAGLDREARLAAELGMTGKGAIHPKQLPIIEPHFTPSDEAIAQARRVTQAFEAADSGLVVVDGKLVELPVVRSAYRVLAIAERMAARAG